MSSLVDLQAILRCHFASFVEKCFQEVSMVSLRVTGI